MDVEMAKILAGVGAILAAIGPFGYGIFGIIGAVLLLIGIISLADFYGDQDMRRDAVYWFIFAVIALIVLVVGIVVGLLSLGNLTHGNIFANILTIAGLAAVVIAAWVLYVLSAKRYRNVMSSLAKRSGEGLFETAGTLYFWGAMLTIVLVGVILILIAYILTGVAFIVMKTPTKSQ